MASVPKGCRQNACIICYDTTGDALKMPPPPGPLLSLLRAAAAAHVNATHVTASALVLLKGLGFNSSSTRQPAIPLSTNCPYSMICSTHPSAPTCSCPAALTTLLLLKKAIAAPGQLSMSTSSWKSYINRQRHSLLHSCGLVDFCSGPLSLMLSQTQVLGLTAAITSMQTTAI